MDTKTYIYSRDQENCAKILCGQRKNEANKIYIIYGLGPQARTLASWTVMFGRGEKVNSNCSLAQL